MGGLYLERAREWIILGQEYKMEREWDIINDVVDEAESVNEWGRHRFGGKTK